MKEQMGSELKQLPFMLGKVLGGLMAVIGFGAAVYIYTHGPAMAPGAVLPCLLTGIGGLIIFRISSWLSKRRAKDSEDLQPTEKEKKRTSAISWIILLVLAAAFVIFMLALGK